MKVGLWSLEPKIENTALMQISHFHKQKGDQVEWYSPLYQYDKIYCSSLFTFTKKPKRKPNMEVGGSGFDIHKRLPPKIEACNLDYSIYPKCKTSYIWFSRGCNKNCPYCVVHAKEGPLKIVEPKNLNVDALRISVMDNSFTQMPMWAIEKAVEFLKEVNLPVDWQCGFDPEILSYEKWEAIRSLRHYKQFRTEWDNPRKDLRENLEIMGDFFGRSQLMVYVLIGYWSTPKEDLYRVKEIRKLGLDPWVMPYDKTDPYQKAFERWCNRHVGCEWEEYSHGSWNPDLIVLTQKSEKGEKAHGV